MSCDEGRRVNMKRLDIETLRALCAIVDYGGITRAAEKLSLSQSAISHKIMRLESAIGNTVLTRRPGAPLLSDEGVRLLAYARRICALHDEALQNLGRQPLSGRIRLGMTEDVTSSDLSLILGRFTRSHPEVSVHTRVDQSLILRRRLDRGEIDVAVMQIFSNQVEASDMVLFRDKLHWVKAADVEFAPGAAFPFLSYDDACFYKNWAFDADHLHPAGLRIVLECASSAGIASAVRSGLGIALLPGRYVTEEMQIIGGQFPDPPGLAYVLRTGRNAHSKAVQALAKEISDRVTSLATLRVA